MASWPSITHRSSFAGLALVALAAALGCSREPELGKFADLTSAASIRTAMTGGSEAGAGEAAATGTGWGTLKGKFTFAGDKPKLPGYPVNKDESVCAPGGAAPEQQFLIIDPSTKGIANIAIIVRKVSRVHESAEPKAGDVTFDQKGCIFLTHMTPILVGQTLGIKNSDPVGHNTNISGGNTFNQTIPAGQTVPMEIKKEDAVPSAVRCSIHPWMISYLLPRKNGYFAVTKPDGTFEIPNLPAGEKLEIQVWHEWAAGGQGGLVADAPELKDLKWSKKGRFTLLLKEDETRDLQITLPPSAFKPI